MKERDEEEEEEEEKELENLSSREEGYVWSPAWGSFFLRKGSDLFVGWQFQLAVTACTVGSWSVHIPWASTACCQLQDELMLCNKQLGD